MLIFNDMYFSGKVLLYLHPLGIFPVGFASNEMITAILNQSHWKEHDHNIITRACLVYAEIRIEHSINHK